MIKTIYTRALEVLMKKPLKLWGLSLLSIFLISTLSGLCGIAIPVLGIAVGCLISTAMTMIFLKGYRGEESNTLDLFAYFKDWATAKRILLGLGWTYLWITLWALIPFIGPIIAIVRIYEYRLVPYILVFEPEVPITEARKISSKRTMGYKLQMWLADFVYALIVGIALFVLAMFSVIPVLGLIFILAAFVLEVLFMVLAPLFAGLVKAAFYEEITKSL